MNLYGDEIPYQTTVLVREFKEKTTLVKIEQISLFTGNTKSNILGEGGKMIKKIGTECKKRY